LRRMVNNQIAAIVKIKNPCSFCMQIPTENLTRSIRRNTLRY
jgi:hypothetical protein